MAEQDPLKAFFDAGEAPAVDPAFKARTMDRIAQRRLRVELALRFVAGGLLVLGFMALAPTIALIGQGVFTPELTPAFLAVGLSLAIAWTGHYLINHSIQLPRLRFF